MSELAALAGRIRALRVAYFALLLASIAILALGVRGMPFYGYAAWAATFGGTVFARLARLSLLERYQRMQMGEPE